MSKPQPPATIVLTSGGIDSACLLALCGQDSRSVEALFVDYGQAARAHESLAACRLAACLGARRSHLTLNGMTFGPGEIVGRNAFLAHVALLAMRGRAGRVFMGIHAGTGYRDCSPDFAELIQRSYDFHADGRVQFVVPFLDRAKAEVYGYAQRLNVPLDLTYSCERGVEPPCGTCRSCLDREVLGETA